MATITTPTPSGTAPRPTASSFRTRLRSLHLAPAVVPEVERSRLRRLVAPSSLVVGLTVASVALHFRDPHEQGTWGQCPSAAVGIYCPGCGGLRAVNDLTRGQVGAAASSNLLFFLSLPFIGFLMARWCVDRWRGVERPEALELSKPVVVTLLAVVVAFTVARNTPWGSWLAP